MGYTPDRKHLWIDCSRPIGAATGVWPGDRKPVVEQRVEPGFVLSSFTTTCHVGTHVDAPMHLDPAAAAVHEIALDRFIGPAEVVRCTRGAASIGRGSLPEGWRPGASRVLFRTDSWPLGAAVEAGFTAFEPGLAPWLEEHGVTLIGLDAPSVDDFDDPNLTVHHELAAAGITWIEGLWLGAAEAGRYEMIGLPLALDGVEAAPIRVVLRAQGGHA